MNNLNVRLRRFSYPFVGIPNVHVFPFNQLVKIHEFLNGNGNGYIFCSFRVRARTHADSRLVFNNNRSLIREKIANCIYITTHSWIAFLPFYIGESSTYKTSASFFKAHKYLIFFCCFNVPNTWCFFTIFFIW